MIPRDTGDRACALEVVVKGRSLDFEEAGTES